jgi:hypothetical protein
MIVEAHFCKISILIYINLVIAHVVQVLGLDAR